MWCYNCGAWIRIPVSVETYRCGACGAPIRYHDFWTMTTGTTTTGTTTIGTGTISGGFITNPLIHQPAYWLQPPIKDPIAPGPDPGDGFDMD